MKLTFGLATPTQLWQQPLDERRALVDEAYQQGVQHLYMADHVSFHNGAGTDGFVEVAGLSQLHPQMGVMISIYLLPLRHPLPVARQIATMGRLAPGRFTFGIGVGGEDRHEIEVCGVDPKTRGARTNESLSIIRGLLRGETVNFSGDHFQVEAARIVPTPDPTPPILVGGRSDAALRRTGRYGDGWIGVWCSVNRYREAINLINQQADEAERSPHWLHGLQPWVGVADNEADARAAVATGMESFYRIPFEKFERYTPYGTAEQVAEQLAPYAEAGCRMFNLKICTPNAMEEVARAGAVIEQLKQYVR